MRVKLLSFKSSLFTTNDYHKIHKKTRPNPKRYQKINKGKQKFVDLPTCHLCGESSTCRIIEDGTNEEFWLCKKHLELHERKKMKFKPFFEKANELS